MRLRSRAGERLGERFASLVSSTGLLGLSQLPGEIGDQLRRLGGVPNGGGDQLRRLGGVPNGGGTNRCVWMKPQMAVTRSGLCLNTDLRAVGVTGYDVWVMSQMAVGTNRCV